MDQIIQQSPARMCTKHSQKPIEFVQVNGLSNSQNDCLFYCTACINKDLTFKGINHLLISQIIEEGETNIIQKWPPVNDYSILDQLIQITEQQASSRSVVHQINQYFTQLKEEFLKKVDLCQKKMINQALELPFGKESILKQYQDISEISKLRSMLMEGEKKDPQIDQKHCREFITQIEQQKQKNSEQLSKLLQQCNRKEFLINFEYPEQIKKSIFSFVDEIDFFNPRNQQHSQRHSNNNQQEASKSSTLMMLLSNRSNFCSEVFLSEMNVLLDRINPLLSSISFEQIYQSNKTPTEFQRLSEARFDLINKFVEHATKLELERDYSVELERTFEFKQLESIIDSSVNFVSNNFKEQMKRYLIDTYPLLKQINFTNATMEKEKFDCFRTLSNNEIDDLHELIKKRRLLTGDNEYNQSQTKLIKDQSQYIQMRYEDVDQLFRKYPVFDLLQKKQRNLLQVKLIKTDFNDGQIRTQITDGKSVSVNSEYLDSYINCVSDIILQKDTKYIFRIKIEHSRQDNFELLFGLISNRNCNTVNGFKEYLSSYLKNTNNKIQTHQNIWGLSKKLQGDQVILSNENEIEMRVWLGGQQLELLDYPNYLYKLGIEDRYKNKLIEINDLKLYLSISNTNIKLTLMEVITVNEFPN